MIEKCSWRDAWSADIEDMVGRTFTSVEKTEYELNFICEDGTFKFYHDQDCCESVYIESITGDLEDLVNTPITFAAESNSDDQPPESDYGYDSYTWTFYKFATIKGWVDVRWFGESNGYYSESVDLEFVPSEKFKSEYKGVTNE